MGCSASQPRGSVTRRLEGLSASAARELLLRELRQGLAADEPDSSGELPLAAVLRLDQPCPALEVLLKAGASASDSHIADALFARLRLQRSANRNTVQLLLESGLDANSADNSPGCSRDTLLVASVRAGEDGLVEDLLAAGADVNGADQHGNTALHVAAAKASEAVAERLLRGGASATVKNADGHSAVLSARLGAIAPALRLSAAGGWASKEVLSAKVAGKLDARVLDVGEEVWRCPISKECWTGSASPPTAPRNHQVAAMLAQAAGDAYSLADAVEGAWLAGQVLCQMSMSLTSDLLRSEKSDLSRQKSTRERSWRQALEENIPILYWLPRYPLENLQPDFAGSITLGCILIGQSLAHANLCMVNLINGPYSCMLPPIVYAFFGTCVHASVGTGGLVSLLTGEVLAPLGDLEERTKGGKLRVECQSQTPAMAQCAICLDVCCGDVSSLTCGHRLSDTQRLPGTQQLFTDLVGVVQGTKPACLSCVGMA
ncbi:SULTR3 [Symbiodinium sp. CCMP2456]|nr:SULTR3 [Symbiodinium sp. CCMP2456]